MMLSYFKNVIKTFIASYLSQVKSIKFDTNIIHVFSQSGINVL